MDWDRTVAEWNAKIRRMIGGVEVPPADNLAVKPKRIPEPPVVGLPTEVEAP